MKKILAVFLALLLVLAVLAACGETPTEEAAEEAVAETASDTEATAEKTEETPAMAANEALLQLGQEELPIRISEVSLEEGKLVIPIEGITMKNAWRDLIVEVVLDGEKIFMETSEASSDGYKRTSLQAFDKLPEQVLLYADGNEDNALVYDVEAGAFVN